MHLFSSISSSQEETDSDYFSQFSCPDDSDDDDDFWSYFHETSNDDVLLTDILNRQQLNELNSREENRYQRSKRSHKKINAQRQIKTKYAQSIKIHSHNKHLYIHHRIFKRVQLDPPSQNYISSSSEVSRYSPADLRAIRDQQQPKVSPPVRSTVTSSQPVNQFREYTIQHSNIPNEPSFDDAMIRFLLDMQNRDLYVLIVVLSIGSILSLFRLVVPKIMKCYYVLMNVFNERPSIKIFSILFRQFKSIKFI